jgi:DNA mismatch repair ATPase MutS
MAGYAHLNKLSAQVRRDAVERLETLLPSEADEGDAREGEAFQAAIRDGVASKDPEFQVYALVGALSRVVERQQQQLDALEAKDSTKDSTKGSAKRSSASRSPSTTKSKK